MVQTNRHVFETRSTVILLFTTTGLEVVFSYVIQCSERAGPKLCLLPQDRENFLQSVGPVQVVLTSCSRPTLPGVSCLFLFSCRANGASDSGGDAAAGDRPQRGALPLPEPPDGAPPPRGEVRRPQGGGGTVLGKGEQGVSLLIRVSRRYLSSVRVRRRYLSSVRVSRTCLSSVRVRRRYLSS